MDYPEPISSMLRNYDWDAYIATSQPIPIQNVERNTTPYIFTNNSGTIKVVGFIRGYLNSSTREIYKNMFALNFVIEENGRLSHNTPSRIDNVIIYQLPEDIHNEMLLANTICSAVLNLYDLQQQNQIIADIRHLAQINRTDYMKIKLYFYFGENPLAIAMSENNIPVFKELIKHYNYDDYKYKNEHGQTILDKAHERNLPAFVKIIEDAMKENQLHTFLYALDKTGNKLPANIVDDLSEYFVDDKKGGDARKQYKAAKSKRKRNKKRKTHKHK